MEMNPPKAWFSEDIKHPVSLSLSQTQRYSSLGHRKLKADPSHTVANTLTPHRAGQCSASTLSVRHAGMLLIRCIRGTLVTYFAWQSHALLLNTKTRLKIFKYFKNIICSTCSQAFGTISPMLVHSTFSALLLACFFSFFFLHWARHSFFMPPSIPPPPDTAHCLAINSNLAFPFPTQKLCTRS